MAERLYERGCTIADKYVCERLIGKGGFGSVYLVRHRYLDTLKVMKVLHAHLADREDLTARMHAEAKVLAAMHHPNVVHVDDGGVNDDGCPYFLMEVLVGDTLEQLLSEAPKGLGIRATLRLIPELCDGLAYAHTKHGVIHRDLKPANIFIESTPGWNDGRIQTRPKILDFGVAHFVGKHRAITGQMFLGTERYAAPEQIRGEKPTPRTDIYSLGLIVYECLCGRGPFDEARRAEAIARAHLDLEPPPLRSFVHVPDEIDLLVMAMLAKDPSRRPPSAAWLAAAFRAIRDKLNAEHDKTDSTSLNKTDPEPIEARFITLSVPRSGEAFPVVAKGSPVTAPAGPDAIRRDAEHDTVPEPLPPWSDRTVEDPIPMGGARTLLPERADAQLHRPTSRGEPDPSINRNAPTPTMAPVVAPAARHGTVQSGSPLVYPHPTAVVLEQDKIYMPPPSEGDEEPRRSPGPTGGSMYDRPPPPTPAHGRRAQLFPASSSAAVVVSSPPARPRRGRDTEILIVVAIGLVTAAVCVLMIVILWPRPTSTPASASASAAASAPDAATSASASAIPRRNP